MKVGLITESDIDLLREIFEDDNMVYNKVDIKKFIDTPNSYAFVLKNEEKVIGFAYGYALVRLDGKTMFYLHSIGILPDSDTTIPITIELIPTLIIPCTSALPKDPKLLPIFDAPALSAPETTPFIAPDIKP